jgi:hypothetical protein
MLLRLRNGHTCGVHLPTVYMGECNGGVMGESEGRTEAGVSVTRGGKRRGVLPRSCMLEFVGCERLSPDGPLG